MKRLDPSDAFFDYCRCLFPQDMRPNLKDARILANSVFNANSGGNEVCVFVARCSFIKLEVNLYVLCIVLLFCFSRRKTMSLLVRKVMTTVQVLLLLSVPAVLSLLLVPLLLVLQTHAFLHWCIVHRCLSVKHCHWCLLRAPVLLSSVFKALVLMALCLVAVAWVVLATGAWML
jgi:hypothetical protein